MDKHTIVNLEEWITERSERIKLEYLEKYLSEKGLESSEDNMKLAEYDIDFTDGLKNAINENNLLSLIDDETGVVSYRLENTKIKLQFSNGYIFEVFVDTNGKIQTSLAKI